MPSSGDRGGRRQGRGITSQWPGVNKSFGRQIYPSPPPPPEGKFAAENMGGGREAAIADYLCNVPGERLIDFIVCVQLSHHSEIPPPVKVKRPKVFLTPALEAQQKRDEGEERGENLNQTCNCWIARALDKLRGGGEDGLLGA